MPRSGGRTPRPAAEPAELPEEQWLKLQSVLAELGDESGLMDEDDFGIALELCQVADAGGIARLIQKCTTDDGQVEFNAFLQRCKSPGVASPSRGGACGSPPGDSKLVRSSSGNHLLRTSGSSPRPPGYPAPSPAPQPPTPPDLRATTAVPLSSSTTTIVEWMWGDAGTAATRGKPTSSLPLRVIFRACLTDCL